ncbi:HlyD family efflux transporter periplasmic adaptor subunit [Cohnella terricola]|uniref:HlyD family efflux transporter periplasmic adaptor subunit n=1 Tax=Cohnella terricola TaxID=1289167 RepID=A0A559JWJ4_9BACL|nr:HlyD family efflux transporter periplasmic adaptor subunit [Cohnella terricola]TVY04265.1 HlyD family efflux transporter periplasmic adaptor subunit [Cohnella terricola]
MKLKSVSYFIIAIVLVAGGSLLATKGKDAVSKAENRKQAVLEVEQKTVIYDKNPGTIVNILATVGDSVKQGDPLFKVRFAEGGEAEVSAPADGSVSQIAVKAGDRVAQGLPVAIVQKNAYYADFYVQEGQIQKLKAGQSVSIHFPYTEHSAEVDGVVTTVATAPQFANLRMTRERGQADISMYAVRIAIDANAALLPGMTAEVDLDEIVD